MNFLGLYNLIMALAVAGACGVCNPGATQDYDGPAYMAQGDELPPVGSIIDHPPTRVDGGYWAAYYWNHPHDEDGDEADQADSRGPSDDDRYAEPAYDPATAAADRGYGATRHGEDASAYDYGRRQVYFPSDRERRAQRHPERRQDQDRARADKNHRADHPRPVPAAAGNAADPQH